MFISLRVVEIFVLFMLFFMPLSREIEKVVKVKCSYLNGERKLFIMFSLFSFFLLSLLYGEEEKKRKIT